MKIIKNKEELAKIVTKEKDLILPYEDIRIEYQFTREELRNVECGTLTLENNNQKFDFNGRDFNGWDFNGWDFNGRNFNGRNFNGGDFTGGDFTGGNFNGKKVLYYASFISYNSIKCTSIEGRREKHLEPMCIDGKLEIIPEEKEVSLSGKEVSVTIDNKTYTAIIK